MSIVFLSPLKNCTAKSMYSKLITMKNNPVENNKVVPVILSDRTTDETFSTMKGIIHARTISTLIRCVRLELLCPLMQCIPSIKSRIIELFIIVNNILDMM